VNRSRLQVSILYALNCQDPQNSTQTIASNFKIQSESDGLKVAIAECFHRDQWMLHPGDIELGSRLVSLRSRLCPRITSPAQPSQSKTGSIAVPGHRLRCTAAPNGRATARYSLLHGLLELTLSERNRFVGPIAQSKARHDIVLR
jgi:hypothetical protein